MRYRLADYIAVWRRLAMAHSSNVAVADVYRRCARQVEQWTAKQQPALLSTVAAWRAEAGRLCAAEPGVAMSYAQCADDMETWIRQACEWYAADLAGEAVPVDPMPWEPQEIALQQAS